MTYVCTPVTRDAADLHSMILTWPTFLMQPTWVPNISLIALLVHFDDSTDWSSTVETISVH